MHPDGAEPYITIIVGWTDGENSAFWAQRHREELPAGTVIGEVHKDLACAGKFGPLRLRWCTTLMISAMIQMVRNCISPIIVGWTDGENSAFGCTRARGTYIAPAQLA
jgi:hypothetical protein